MGGMKCMVLVPVGMRGAKPCARRPISFSAASSQSLLSGPSFSWAYSREAPVAGSMTELALQNAAGGRLHGLGVGAVVVRGRKAGGRGRRVVVAKFAE